MPLPDVTRDGTFVTVSLERCIEADPMLQARRGECRRMLMRHLRRFGRVSPLPPRCAVRIPLGESVESLDGELPAIRRQLERIANRALTPKLVVQLLAILPRERIRWTKDGRLRMSGSVSFGAATTISCATYGADEIRRLIARPDIVATWRKRTRKAPPGMLEELDGPE